MNNIAEYALWPVQISNIIYRMHRKSYRVRLAGKGTVYPFVGAIYSKIASVVAVLDVASILGPHPSV
jgi:hypothetical protein